MSRVRMGVRGSGPNHKSVLVALRSSLVFPIPSLIDCAPYLPFDPPTPSTPPVAVGLSRRNWSLVDPAFRHQCPDNAGKFVSRATITSMRAACRRACARATILPARRAEQLGEPRRMSRRRSVRSHERLHIGRRDQANRVAELADLAPPIVRASTGFHGDQAGRLFGKELKHLIPAQLFPENNDTRGIRPVGLKHTLRKSSPIVLTSISDTSFVVAVNTDHLGTSMPSRGCPSLKQCGTPSVRSSSSHQANAQTTSSPQDPSAT